MDDSKDADRIICGHVTSPQPYTAVDALERAREAQQRTDVQLSMEWMDEAYIGTCQSCGRYLDVRQHDRCPSPCDGYIG